MCESSSSALARRQQSILATTRCLGQSQCACAERSANAWRRLICSEKVVPMGSLATRTDAQPRRGRTSASEGAREAPQRLVIAQDTEWREGRQSFDSNVTECWACSITNTPWRKFPSTRQQGFRGGGKCPHQKPGKSRPACVQGPPASQFPGIWRRRGRRCRYWMVGQCRTR
jgi:hypothetical protein